MSNWSTCRFCKETSYHPEKEGVRYAVRHFAHFKCYLDAGKSLDNLTPWQVGLFPFQLLKAKGLIDQATKITAARKIGGTITGRYTGTGPGNLKEVKR